MKNWVNVLSIVAVVTSMAALIVSLCRIEPVTAEWLGLLVGILGMLTSVLLGWQVFSIINYEYCESTIGHLLKMNWDKLKINERQRDNNPLAELNTH